MSELLCHQGCELAAWSMPVEGVWRCGCTEASSGGVVVILSEARPVPGSVAVIGTGSSLPARAVSGDDPYGATSNLAVRAGQAALERAGIRASALSMLIVATSTPDNPPAPAAGEVAERLGVPAAAAAFDLNAVCGGFVFALALAQHPLLGAGGYALVIGADAYPRIPGPTARGTPVRSGDGAGAAVLGRVRSDGGILATRLFRPGAAGDPVPAGGNRQPAPVRTAPEGRPRLATRGRAAGDVLVEHVLPAVERFLHDVGVSRDEVDHVIPDQVNGATLADLERALRLPRARLHPAVEEHRICGAASIAVTLDTAVRTRAIDRGDLVLLAGLGGGMVAGLALVRWP